jgi:hypothetical protein
MKVLLFLRYEINAKNKTVQIGTGKLAKPRQKLDSFSVMRVAP